MSIYTPYFYVIQEVSTGMYYAGAKWGVDANPDNFMIEGGYTTSSKVVNKIVEENGFDFFVIRKLRTFFTAKQAYDYETRFLQKINARKNHRFYNCHNNNYVKHLPGSDEWKDEFIRLYGVDNPMKIPSIERKTRKTKLEKYGNENYNNRQKAKETLGASSPMKIPSIERKTRKTKLEKYGNENYNNRQKAKETLLSQKGVEHHMQDEISRNNFCNSMNMKYGVSYSMQSEEIKKKHSNTMLERYGVRTPTQIPEVKEKIKDKIKLKTERDLVKKLKLLCKEYNLSLGYNWSRKSDDYLISKILEIENRYQFKNM